MVLNSVSGNEFHSNSGEDNLPAILALTTLLILFFAYCCWGSTCLRKLFSRTTLCHRGGLETSQNIGDAEIGQSANSPTIILLPQGRILVVDGPTLSRFHARNSGVDLFELGNHVLQQERNRMARSDTVTELDREANVKVCRPKSESPLPPTYESLFCDIQQTVPPSYAEVIMDRTFPESSSTRELMYKENNQDSIEKVLRLIDKQIFGFPGYLSSKWEPISAKNNLFKDLNVFIVITTAIMELGLPIITHNYTMIGTGQMTNIDISVAEFILDSMKKNPDYCLVHAETGSTISNKVLLKSIVALAGSLKSRGVKADDVIAICSENKLEYVVPIIATLSLGATVITINPLYTRDELMHVLSISRPKIVFCSPFTADKVKEIQNSLPFLNEIVVFDSNHSCEGFTSFTHLINGKVDVSTFQCARVNPRESVAVILCSSGTTGLPKCVELSHSNVMGALSHTRNSRLMAPEEPVTLGLVPFFHGYGFIILLSSVAFSIKLIVMSKFDEEAFLSNIQKYKISTLCAVPPLLVFLAKHPLVSKYDLSSLREVLCGAAPLSRNVQFAVQKRLNLSKDINQGYGMTELSLVSCMMPKNKTKLGSVGVVVTGMECKVIDPETNKSLPPFKEGELCFRGPGVMKGYKNNPAATAAAIDSEGWLHTGDVGYYDEDGYLFIVDRLKELIKYKGFQVTPAELEALLLTHPKVKDAAVVGLQNEEAGELPIAFVVKQPDVEATEAEIKAYVAGKVSPQKRLHIIHFTDEIPKNPSGKILRRELRKMVNKSKL